MTLAEINRIKSRLQALGYSLGSSEDSFTDSNDGVEYFILYAYRGTERIKIGDSTDSYNSILNAIEQNIANKSK